MKIFNEFIRKFIRKFSEIIRKIREIITKYNLPPPIP